MRKLILLPVLGILLYTANSQHYTFSGNYTGKGFEILQSGPQHISMAFSLQSIDLIDMEINRETCKKIELPGNFLPNDEGMPDLPGSGRYLAIPQGATASVRITRMQTETLRNVNLAPAPRIPKTTENGPLFYAKNQSVYNSNALYPLHPVQLSEPAQIRGVDVVMLGITPFQYNPVTKELIIYRDMEIEVSFKGGNGQFGENRLRSRWWEPLLADMLVNYEELPSPSPVWGRDGVGAEYLIICPDDPIFLAWADTIRVFRNKQGIKTGIVTTTETGGNTVSAIRNYINNAYNTWDIPPSAILILGDYGTSGSTIISPIWDSYCASDNIFGDVNDDDLPDIVMSRIMAQTADQLEIMIGKFIGYETNPPVNPEYYDHPVTALGWQTERWFQVCIEVVGGFMKNILGKDPVRINAVYDGNPSVDPWSTAPNTSTVMNYFGPNGLGYIPTSPNTLGNWSGGNANQINAAINDGSFLLLHRDHGYEQGWGEPAYSTSSLGGLSNEDLTFVYSVNCLTGKFNYGGECFAEGFYRHPKRALGIIAASEVSYSFVNDTYVWGAFDNMWPEFMPGYGTTPESRGLLPAFSNAAGKFFLEQSGWPYNTGNKEVTYHLFHHFGDAFSTLYSEVPQELLVLHNEVMIGGSTAFSVQADSGSLIALSVNGEIIGVAEGTGSPADMPVIAQLPGTVVDLVVTKTNYYRYEASIMVISPDAPYVIYQDHLLNDANGNGLMDYSEEALLTMTVQNIGNVDAEDVSVILRSSDPYVTITDSVEIAGNIAGNQSALLPDAFGIMVSDTISDGHIVFFTVKSDDGDSTWNSGFYLVAHAPVLEFTGFTIEDPEGNNNGRIDPGETANILVSVQNAGSATAYNMLTSLSCPGGYITIHSATQNSGNLAGGESTGITFVVSAGELTPGGFNAVFTVNMESDQNRHGEGTFTTVIGQYSALVLDLDPNSHSAPSIMQSFSDMDLIAEYASVMPADLKLYKSVFVCLGIYYSSHELTQAEAQVLEDYLEDGGKIYMEGRLTWHLDPQTSLHQMFNITSTASDWYEIDSVRGAEGTFTEGMNYVYDMTQPFNNHVLHATGPAFEIFRLATGSDALMIASDAVEYKTIGSSIEFGGLVDGNHPSTRKELMSRILEFFGDILTGVDHHAVHARQFSIGVYPNPFTNEVNFSFQLEEPSRVTLDIYDVTGKLIKRITEAGLGAGNHRLVWDPSPVDQSTPHGIYFYRFNSGIVFQGGKIILTE
jgi:hypothetical protein